MMSENNKCGFKNVRCTDDIEAGHIEYVTLSLCGEDIACFEVCFLNWYYCPYCGKKWSKDVK